MTTLEIAAYLAAACVALTRMAPKLEFLWAKVPPSVRWLPPVVLAALPELAAALGQVKEKADWGRFAMVALALFLPGARSASHAALAKDAPSATPKTGSGAPPILPLLCLAFVLIGCGKQALPPGCTEADFAALAATCPSEDECNRMIDERQTQCSKKVEAE